MTETIVDYTPQELLNKLTPSSRKVYVAQLLSNGLSVNMANAFTELVKDAARCNDFSSDIIYDINDINRQLAEFVNSFTPIWIGFRRHGVDGTQFVLSRIKEYGNVYDCIFKEYFALYSVHVEPDNNFDGFYDVVFCKYNT